MFDIKHNINQLIIPKVQINTSDEWLGVGER